MQMRNELWIIGSECKGRDGEADNDQSNGNQSIPVIWINKVAFFSVACIENHYQNLFFFREKIRWKHRKKEYIHENGKKERKWKIPKLKTTENEETYKEKKKKGAEKMMIFQKMTRKYRLNLHCSLNDGFERKKTLINCLVHAMVNISISE